LNRAARAKSGVLLIFHSQPSAFLINYSVNISELKAGERYVVEGVSGAGRERQRLLDLGFTPRTELTVFNVAPFGGTVLLGLRGYMLALRQNACDLLRVKKCPRGSG
jgi:Fe2+ transport system protein FeoA